MKDYLQNKIWEWNDEASRETKIRLEYLEKKLFSTYQNTLPPHPDFWRRLENWIKNVDGNTDLEIQLFNSINHIFYIGPQEFYELYRQAYKNIVARWLIDLYDIEIADENASDILNSSVSQTWFCPISDSFNINQFYHVNDIHVEADIRPDWRSLSVLSPPKIIRQHILRNNIKQIVLLEDFVGGGSQMRNAILFALNFSDIVDILVIPLIICPRGKQLIGSICAQNQISFEPVLTLSSKVFINETPQADEHPSFIYLRDVANQTYQQVSGGLVPEQKGSDGLMIKPYHPLGWDKTGGLVVMFTNTPDNTLPMFHNESDDWFPIFRRHYRNK